MLRNSYFDLSSRTCFCLVERLQSSLCSLQPVLCFLGLKLDLKQAIWTLFIHSSNFYRCDLNMQHAGKLLFWKECSYKDTLTKCV